MIGLLKAFVGIREGLAKTTPGYTFPKLGVADDQRSTPIVTAPGEVRTKARLMSASLENFEIPGISLA